MGLVGKKSSTACVFQILDTESSMVDQLKYHEVGVVSVVIISPCTSTRTMVEVERRVGVPSCEDRLASMVKDKMLR